MPARRLGIVNHFIGAQPAKGLRVMRLSLNFYEGLNLTFDATSDKLSNVFGTPQAIYIDNSQYNGVLTCIPSGTDMPIYCPSNSVGMFPFAVSEKLRAQFIHTIAEADVDAWLFNSPQLPFVHAVV